MGGAAAGLAVADIGYAVAHAEGKAGAAGAVGVFVAVVVFGGIELDFTAGGQGGACVADDAVAAYQQVLVALYGDLAAAEAT